MLAAAADTPRAAIDEALDRAKVVGVVDTRVTVAELCLLLRGFSRVTATVSPAPSELRGAIGIIWRGLATSKEPAP